MKPIIKWPGGKRELCPKILELLPFTYNNYYEPFLGGGAVLLNLDLNPNLNPKEAVVNDVNSELINMYLQVRDNVEKVIDFLVILDITHEHADDPKEFYYAVRADYNRTLGCNTPAQAAQFIYLNKHCFNGLYRVNSKGEFNVPFNGKLSGRSVDPDHLRELSSRLKKVNILNTDFESAVKDAKEGDLVYLDPPYDKDEDISTAGFVAYQKDGWSRVDTVRLKAVCDELTNRGCKVVVSNNDTTFIRELFSNYNITEATAKRSINRNGSDRKGKEVIITNYSLEDKRVPDILSVDLHDSDVIISDTYNKLYSELGLPEDRLINKENTL